MKEFLFKNHNSILRNCYVLVCGLAFVFSAQAQVLEEVVVTAQKRVESLQDVPISVSAINGTKIVQAGITELQDMTAYVPNLTMNETGIGTNITIRGVSSGINQGFEQSVGMFMDGIYWGRGRQTLAPLFDLDRVEVLRGPQGTTFGKNSLAGGVALNTIRPDGTVDYEAELNTGNYGRLDFRGAVQFPVIEDKLSGHCSDQSPCT